MEMLLSHQWLASVKLDTCNWNRPPGEFVTFYTNQLDKFNKTCPESHINDKQAVCMLQNVIANVPNLGNVLNLYRQTKKAAGQPITVSLRDCVALLAQQAQVHDSATTRTGCSCCQSAATHEVDYETNAHNFDQEGDNADLKLDGIWEANVMNQRYPKTGRCLGNKSGNKSTGFKKSQNQKRQANEMQGTRSRAYMDCETWNSLGESDKKAWDGLLDQAKTKVTACHFNKGKEHASQGSKAWRPRNMA